MDKFVSAHPWLFIGIVVVLLVVLVFFVTHPDWPQKKDRPPPAH